MTVTHIRRRRQASRRLDVILLDCGCMASDPIHVCPDVFDRDARDLETLPAVLELLRTHYSALPLDRRAVIAEAAANLKVAI